MPLKDGEIQILAQAQTGEGIVFQIRRDPKGVLEVPQMDSAILSMHLGAAARLSCRRDNRWSSGTAIHGDIDIIPAHTPSRWVMHDENDKALIMSLPQKFLQSLVDEEARSIELRNRFQIRDPEIETLCWAVKREVEASRPSGPFYLEGLSLALASRLISQHSSITKTPAPAKGLSKSSLKDVLEFIEEQLAEDLRLAEIARVAGVSVSHIKKLFTRSTGTPIHHYVVARRIERAKQLLTEDNLSISQIATACGFAHQSHLARHLKRATGMSPRTLKRLFGENAQAK